MRAVSFLTGGGWAGVEGSRTARKVEAAAGGGAEEGDRMLAGRGGSCVSPIAYLPVTQHCRSHNIPAAGRTG